MVRNCSYSTKFNKDIEKAKKQKQDLAAIKEIMDILISGHSLPAKNLDHPLKSNWKGYRECHIQNDLLLIYKLDKSENSIRFERLGTHSELFK